MPTAVDKESNMRQLQRFSYNKSGIFNFFHVLKAFCLYLSCCIAFFEDLLLSEYHAFAGDFLAVGDEGVDVHAGLQLAAVDGDR